MPAGEKGLYISYGATTADKVTLQAEHQGVAFRDLLLNPGGGNVGIGIAAPGSKLEVNGEIRAEGGTVTPPTYTFTGDTDTGMYRSGADIIGFTAAGVVRLEVRTTLWSGRFRTRAYAYVRKPFSPSEYASSNRRV